MESEYKGVKYKSLGDNKWLIIWPSGLKKQIEMESEDKLKQELDKIIKTIA